MAQEQEFKPITEETFSGLEEFSQQDFEEMLADAELAENMDGTLLKEIHEKATYLDEDWGGF